MRLLVEEGSGKDGRFWKLAQSFSALYPSGFDENRWVDGVRARKKGLRFSMETTMNWRERIVSDPQTLHGKVRVQGTRIPVSVVLDNLAAGLSHQELLASYPSLTEEDVRACLAYAAELASERVVDMRTGTAG